MLLCFKNEALRFISLIVIEGLFFILCEETNMNEFTLKEINFEIQNYTISKKVADNLTSTASIHFA